MNSQNWDSQLHKFLVVKAKAEIYMFWKQPDNLIPTLRLARATCSAHLCDVVARRVAEVTAADFGAHVPAVEGRRCELEAAAVEHHAGNGRHGEPPKAQVGKPLVAADTILNYGRIALWRSGG